MIPETTSERVTPEGYSQTVEDYLIYLMHEATYAFVLPHVRGKEVLDFGCGTGYGVKLMADSAAHVTAIDISARTIDEARGNHASERASFLTIRPTDHEPLPFDDHRFGVVVSFQVMEHVEDIGRYLSEIHRVLAPGGKFIVATPNARIRLLPFQRPWNRFHIREFTSDDLIRLLGGLYGRVEMKGLTLKEPWLAREIGRTNRNKWMLWPVTNRLVSPGISRSLLGRIKKLSGGRKRAEFRDAVEDEEWPTKDSALVSDTGIESAPSLIAVCEKT